MQRQGSKPLYNEKQQRKIAELFFTTDLSRDDLAKRYSVSVSTIGNYIRKHRKEFTNNDS